MTAYFFCETTAHILTSYFISKLYLKDIPKVMFLQQGRLNVERCCEAMTELNIWNKVVLVPELKTEEEVLAFYEPFQINGDDIFYFFTYHSVADRGLYYLMSMAGGKLIATDEAGFIVGRFQECRKQVSGTAFLDIDFNRIEEIWMYDFSICTITLGCKRKKIDLTGIAKDFELLKNMQNDVRKLFSIEEDALNTQVIFFDQPLAQVGYISYTATQYLMNMLYDLLSPFGLKIKTHPGELHPESKYSQRPFTILKNSHAPWEALYFVNYYGKKLEPLVLVTYASLAVTSVSTMFGMSNIKAIFLHKIVRKMLKEERQGLFESADLRLEDDKENILLAPDSFFELSRNIKEIFGTEAVSLKTKVIDEGLFQFYLQELKKQNVFLPNYLTGATIQYFAQGRLVYSSFDCWPYEDENFMLLFQCPSNVEFDRCYLSISNSYMLDKLNIENLTWKDGNVERALKIISETQMQVEEPYYYMLDGVAIFRVCDVPNIGGGTIQVSGKWNYKKVGEKTIVSKDKLLEDYRLQLENERQLNRRLELEIAELKKAIEKQKNVAPVSISDKIIKKLTRGRNGL